MNILQLSRIPIYPPKNGRQRRVWEETKLFSDYGDVWLATPEEKIEYPLDTVHSLPLNSKFLKNKFSVIYLWNAACLFGPQNIYHRQITKTIVSWVNRSDITFDLISCDSPQVLDAAMILGQKHKCPFILSKHNSYFEILEDFLSTMRLPRGISDRTVQSLFEFEQKGIESADAVIFQSEADKQNFNIPAGARVKVIPNGTDYQSIRNGDPSQEMLDKFGLTENQFLCAFVGSYDYFPNMEAAETIIEQIAPQLPEVNFLLIGQKPPNTDQHNVHSLGYIEDLAGVLASVDVALCPIFSGSGTKLKILDYLAAGLPIVTTKKGASGLSLESGESALIKNSPDDFAEAIQFLRSSPNLRNKMSNNAYELGSEYSWESLLADYEPLINDLRKHDVQKNSK